MNVTYEPVRPPGPGGWRSDVDITQGAFCLLLAIFIQGPVPFPTRIGHCNHIALNGSKACEVPGLIKDLGLIEF
jgi:hypothetical protein